MHELALCQSIVRTIEEAAHTHHVVHVRRVRLEVGPFAGVELQALRFAFDLATRGTRAEGARLDIIERPGTMWCCDCSMYCTLAQRYDPCPICGGHRLRLAGGETLRIKDLEVD